jgi:hypothetical protein
MLIKLYGEPPSSPEAARRYSPSECVGTRTENITGNPDPKHVSTSYAERANLTMRMAMRRFTRLTNAFSKKLENHAHMVALYALWYNFVRIHKTLRTSPAMAAGIETRLWSMEDVVRACSGWAFRFINCHFSLPAERAGPSGLCNAGVARHERGRVGAIERRVFLLSTPSSAEPDRGRQQNAGGVAGRMRPHLGDTFRLREAPDRGCGSPVPDWC